MGAPKAAATPQDPRGAAEALLRWLASEPGSPVGGPYAPARELVLRGLSGCYFAAFASFLLQVPGLYGPRGLVPAGDAGGMEHRCLWGLGLACLGLCGFGNVPVMWGMLALYHGLVRSAPPPFYNFQWDILLIETGFLGAVLAPLLHSALEPRPSRAALWMLRLALFKLMLMSGVVKLTEGDSSWDRLTAIWYHFATQCIPTPAAWYFHNLPMWMEKLFCAACFVIEIPAAFLILVPEHRVQAVAALLQIALQLVIILTGNYTFFNYLTIFLACSLLHSDAIPRMFRPASCEKAPVAMLLAPGAQGAPPERGRRRGGGAPGAGEGEAEECREAEDEAEGADLLEPPAGSGPGAAGPAAVAAEPQHGPSTTDGAGMALGLTGVAPMCGWGCLAVCLAVLLGVSRAYGLNPDLEVTLSDQDLLDSMSYWVPHVLVVMSIVIPVVTVMDIVLLLGVDGAALVRLRSPEQALQRHGWKPPCALGVVAASAALLLLRGAVCYQMLCLMPGPLSEIAPSLGSSDTRTSFWGRPSSHEMPFGLPHFGPYGYGLFRRMTGIGPRGEVARPELVLEVQAAGSWVWHELQFLYKPGDVARRPPLVAPYQPRLDWQMWFQALTPRPAGWFRALLARVAEGSPEVLALLDTTSLPDEDVTAVRVVAYSYNFTAAGGAAWWRRTPDDEGLGSRLNFKPANLARLAASRPRDWRPHAVAGFALSAAALWAAPRCRQLAAGRPRSPPAASREEKDR